MATDQQSLPLESSRELLLLAHSSSSAKSWNVQHVLNNATGCESAAQIAQPFNVWIEKLWEQNGDGRKIASRLQIQLAILCTLEKHAFQYLENSAGLSATLANCFSQGAGIDLFDSACAAALQVYEQGNLPDAQLSLAAAEQEALACVQKARLMLEEQGLIELGGVLAYLVRHKEEVFLNPLVVRFVDAAPLSAAEYEFFTRCADVCALESDLLNTSPLQRIEAVEVITASALGVLAEPQLVLNIIHDMFADYPESHVVVTCKEPRSLFELIGPALLQAGISSAAQISISFERTDFGRVYSLIQLLNKNAMFPDVAAFSDVLLSPLFGLKKETVWRFNKKLRGDRLMTSEEARALLSGKSPLLDSMLAGDYSKSVFERRFNQLLEQGTSPAYVREQQSAFYALCDVLALIERFGMTDSNLQNALLEQISFPASRELVAQNRVGEMDDMRAGYLPQVRIMSQQAARALPPGSVELLIVCNLTTESYPLSDGHSAVQMIFQTLGIQEQIAILDRERAAFDELLHVASRRIVLERCLNDAKADPLYPSAMLEEFLAAYTYANEEVPCAYMLSEADFVSDAHPIYPGCEASIEELPITSRDNVSVHLGLLPPHTLHQVFPELPRLSPSQLEQYLDCPYKWFVVNRLGTDTLDEDLGPAQKGSFLHAVFHRFYTSFGQKVAPNNLEEANLLMFGSDGAGGIFAQVVAEQYAKIENDEPLRNRFVPRQNTSEILEFDTLKNLVRDWLVFETTFLPAYHPIMLEQRFQGVSLAGCELTGVIDRIDQDNEGHLVIIDYKGALNASYAPLNKDHFLDNGKIQALLYALLVDELDEVAASRDDIAGSLYVSYKKGNEVRGAYRARYFGKSEIPTIVSNNNCCLKDDTPLSFASLLDFTEERIAQAVDGIKRGDIAPLPQSSTTCKYCPVLTCEMRGK